MGFYRHEKEKLFVEKVFKVLDEKYNGNMSFFKQAENEAKEQEKLISKLKKASLYGNELITDLFEEKKHIIFDLKNEKIFESFSNKNLNHILAYSLDFLSTRKILPFSFNELITKTYYKEYSKAKNFNEKAKLTQILQWVSLRSQWNIQLQNCALNKKEGKLNYSTLIKDPGKGTFTQTITIFLDKEKKIDINGYKTSEYAKNVSLDFSMLFKYFILLGGNEIYSSCNCPDFNRKHSKKYGNSNFLCSHLMFSLTQLPYYVYYLLGNSGD